MSYSQAKRAHAAGAMVAALSIVLTQDAGAQPRADLRSGARGTDLPASAPVPATLVGLPALTHQVGAAPEGPRHCELCRTGVRVEALPAEAILCAARALARRNEEEIARIDRLLASDRLGPRDSRDSRRRAHVLARLALANWYSFLYPYVSDAERVISLDADALAGVVTRYCESSVFPAVRLRELRMGRGRVCARFDLEKRSQGWMVMGGKRMRYVVEDVKIDGRRRRVLRFEWPSGSVGHTDVLLEDHYSFGMAKAGAEQTPGGYELYLAHQLEGAWVRRMGLHRPTAFAFWVTPPPNQPPYLPGRPLVGCAIYVPGLKFKLPLFLPDVNLADLRILNLPLPFVPVGELQPQRMPDWLEFEGRLELADWKGLGDTPELLRRLFPDY